MPVVACKAELPPGPWHDEPDRLDFEHKGLPCLVTRHDEMYYLCGYAAVLPGHSLHGKRFDALGDGVELIAHGGVNYSSACSGKICHVPKPGEPDDVWWFGFHCGFGWDGIPTMAYALADTVESYRDINYVKANVILLAEQLVLLA